jgi:hypothetical protein
MLPSQKEALMKTIKILAGTCLLSGALLLPALAQTTTTTTVQQDGSSVTSSVGTAEIIGTVYSIDPASRRVIVTDEGGVRKTYVIRDLGNVRTGERVRVTQNGTVITRY